MLVFPSVHGFKQFLKATATGAIEEWTDALGSELLAVTFESATELPPSMLREAMEHRWPVATADAYPLVQRRAPDGKPLPLVERDFQIATACALSFTALFTRHAVIFESATFDAVCESYFNDDDLEVRFTAPYYGLGGLRLDGIGGTRAALPGADADVPAEGQPQRTLPVRQRTQVQEVSSRARRGRARQPSGHHAARQAR